MDVLGLCGDSQVQQANANAEAMEKTVPSWRSPHYDFNKSLFQKILGHGFTRAKVGALTMVQFGPYGMVAGGLAGFGMGMATGAFIEKRNIDVPDWVKYVPIPEVPNKR